MAEPLSLGHLGRILLRFWALLIVGTILGASAAIGLSFVMTPVYTATATQLVKGVPGTGSAANYEAAQYAVSRAKSYPAFILSAKVLDGVRSDLRGTESLDDLRRDLSATNPVDTPLLRIAAVGPTPENAQAKANSAARQMALFLVQIETVGGKSPIQIETPVVAALPIDTTSPKRKLMTGVGALAGFAVATLVALVLAARRTSELPAVAAASLGAADPPRDTTVPAADLAPEPEPASALDPDPDSAPALDPESEPVLPLDGDAEPTAAEDADTEPARALEAEDADTEPTAALDADGEPAEADLDHRAEVEPAVETSADEPSSFVSNDGAHFEEESGTETVRVPALPRRPFWPPQ